MPGSFTRAEKLLLAGRHRECADFCRRELEQWPRSVTLRVFLAEALLKSRRHLAALHEVEHCLQIDPSSAPARALLEKIEHASDVADDESGPTLVRSLQGQSTVAPVVKFSPAVVYAPAAAAPAWLPVLRPARPPSWIGRTLAAARLARTLRAALWITVGVAAAIPFSRLTRPGSRPTVAQSAILPTASSNDTPPAVASPVDAHVAALLDDLWIHPLAGPSRRMPLRDSRLFGAEREGDRPGECRAGHCGVDIGGERYGEPVLAAHDGVVEHVERGRNPLRGGRYVRIAHRDGTVYTQYFHLASIPAQMQPGTAVKVGEVIGFVGQSGVHHSAPHLHFTVAVKPGGSEQERYIDPEPLIALWPLHIPADAGGGPTIAADIDPGLARGLLRRSRRHHHRHREP